MTESVDDVWVDSMPAAYERWLAPVVFRPFAVDLARRASALAPRRVLELAAGTGVLTRELVAAIPAVELTATDLNDAMVELGRRLTPGADWRQADAMVLPFDDGQFDLVACQFGVMFLPDKPAAFAEARRVLVPGGTLLVNAWATVEAHDFEAPLVAALARAFPDDPPRFIVSVPHGYADPDIVVADLRAGGFDRVVVESVTVEGHAGSAKDVAAGYCAGTPVRAEIVTRGGDLDATTAIVAAEMEARLGSGSVTGSMSANVFEARRAG